ncbi:hypothetical protein [Magnetospirillum molischianum]|uniref:Uncharacterized protein n=1 Tax=Magnetospirillum molischianum DSM 120 TaxID=1150626 RepID=H8FUA8_MAGML|nr:hypothetical protein [Magnetospirillum molischianum]CCG41946.1 conserved hypothetical protein [Magnetospirillum molischianum DSM 120]
MPIPASAEEQEALLQAIIQKIPSVEDPDRLREVTLAALALLLRRPTDRDLRAELTRRIDTIIAGLSRITPQSRHAEMRDAARHCLHVLRTARERRLSRAAEAALAAKRASARSMAATNSHHRAQAGYAVAIAGGITVMVGGLLWIMALRPAAPPIAAEPARLVEQILAAAQGEVPPTHIFGGALRRTTRGDLPVVVAEAVPPRSCAAAGWALVRKGVLTINGVTPSRPSAARITDLCSRSDGDATIQWMPK